MAMKAVISGGQLRKPMCDSLCDTELSPAALRARRRVVARLAEGLRRSRSAGWK